MTPRAHTIADLDPQTSVLLTVDSDLDRRSVFLESITPHDETAVTIVLATAASGEELLGEFDEPTPPAEHLEVIDGTIHSTSSDETPNDVQFMPPVWEYLTNLGDEFSRTLDQLQTEFDNQQSALRNTVGFYSLGPLLDYADDPELVFRFCCILLNQIDNAGGRGVFVIDDSYTTNINRLEVLFDKRVGFEASPDGERTRSLTTTV